MTFNSKGRMDPWSCSMFTSEKARHVSMVHYGEDFSVCSISVSYDGKEVSVVSHYVAPIPEEYSSDPETRYLLSKDEIEHNAKNFSRTVVADDDWMPGTALKKDSPTIWGTALVYLKPFADSELTRYEFEFNAWLKYLKEEAHA